MAGRRGRSGHGPAPAACDALSRLEQACWAELRLLQARQRPRVAQDDPIASVIDWDLACG